MAESDLEEEFVDHLWVVVIKPLRDLGMVWVFGVSPGVEHAIETRYPAAVFGRSEMTVEPPHGDLDDVVQHLERDRGRHLDLAPDQGIAVTQLNSDRADLVEAI